MPALLKEWVFFSSNGNLPKPQPNPTCSGRNPKATLFHNSFWAAQEILKPWGQPCHDRHPCFDTCLTRVLPLTSSSSCLHPSPSQNCALRSPRESQGLPLVARSRPWSALLLLLLLQ